MLSAHWSYMQLIAARLAPLGAGASQDLLARWPIQLGWIAERGGPAAASPELLQEMQLTIPAAVRWAQEPLPHAMPNFYWCASAPGMRWMRLSCRVCCLSPLLMFDKCFCLFSCCEPQSLHILRLRWLPAGCWLRYWRCLVALGPG